MRVVVGHAFDGEHLQRAARRQVAPLIGHEAVEPAGRGVFGLVHDAGLRVDGDRFVAESTHLLEGRRDGVAEGRHVEDVAVRLSQPCGRRAGCRLLARQPRTPRRRPAGAVAHRAAEAGKAFDQPAIAGIELKRCRAAAGVRVVRHGGKWRACAVDFVVPD